MGLAHRSSSLSEGQITVSSIRCMHTISQHSYCECDAVGDGDESTLIAAPNSPKS